MHPRRALALTSVFMFLVACAGAGDASGPGTTATTSEDAPATVDPAQYEEGRLSARPTTVSTPAETGELPLPGPDEGILLVPSTYDPATPSPLAVTLHGCCGGAGSGLSLLREFAEDNRMILVAPEGGGGSWDFGGGSDLAMIDEALREVFATYNVDPARVAVNGFSDGASYALTLGVTNGDLFTHVISHSPGFMSPGEPHGHPRFFVMHGTLDRTLSVENTRELVKELEEQGYGVRYEEFKGGHQRQPTLFAEAVEWFTAGATEIPA